MVLASGAPVKVSAGISDIHHICGKTQTSKKPLHLPERAQTQHCTRSTAHPLVTAPSMIDSTYAKTGQATLEHRGNITNIWLPEKKQGERNIYLESGAGVAEDD